MPRLFIYFLQNRFIVNANVQSRPDEEHGELAANAHNATLVSIYPIVMSMFLAQGDEVFVGSFGRLVP